MIALRVITSRPVREVGKLVKPVPELPWIVAPEPENKPNLDHLQQVDRDDRR